MCYLEGSVSQAVNACPMCKVFPHSRCPHVREVCRNRSLHPQFDVLFLKNAEVQSFNTCGYCRWARLNNSQKLAGLNPGWPGCCRPPAQSEYRMIQAADWRSVSIVHNIPIPPEIKSILDGMTTPSRPSSKQPMPPLDRKSSSGSGGSSGSPPNKSSTASVKSPTGTTAKSRSSASPKTPAATLSKSSSPPTSPPGRKQIEFDASTLPRRNSSAASRPLLNKGSPDLRPSAAKGIFNQQTPERRRSTPVVITTPSKSSSSSFSSTPARSTVPPPRPLKKDDNLSSASSSSGGSDSLSDSTVTSDGGFTDYLSDESEAELQRQAEARAALLAQNQAEELEFKAARLQLTSVDLKPPKVWSSTNITNTATAPRLTNATNRV